MTTRILADVAASITEFKANPMKVATSAFGAPVAVLNRNELLSTASLQAPTRS